MSFTSSVPAAVPSLFHSSSPVAPSSMAKKSVLLTAVNHLIDVEKVPRAKLLSMTVPAAVPSVFQSAGELPSVEEAQK